jgi:chorismate-pyruvate lyase
MNRSDFAPDPDDRGLFGLFPPAEYLARSEIVAADEVPEPYRKLLVHEHHMTVTVEAHHGDLVDVEVLEKYQSPQTYARKILLRLQKSRRVVQFGLVRVHLEYCSPEVRAEIVAGKTPLGRILIEHNVLRRIEPTAFLRVTPGPAMIKWFSLDSPRPTYGRIALIHCDHKPAVELLEIVTPE